MKALFVCDEKEEWTLLTNLFHAHFNKKISLVCVRKAHEAMETLTFDGPFGMIIIECGMKDSDPTDLAEDIFDTVGPRPLIFVGTQTMIKDRVRDDFYNEHDMVTLYEKPYEAEEVTKTIEDAINWAKKEEFENNIVELSTEEFLPLKLRNFYLYQQVPFDVYVELTKTKFIKAISANKPYTQSQIQDFQKRNIKYLYLEKNEHLNFLENSINKIKKSLKLIPQEDPKKRIQTIIAGVLVAHQYIKDVGVADNLKEFIDILIDNISKSLKAYSNLENLLLEFPMEHGDIAEQAVLKALISEFIVKSLGWRSDLTKSKTGLTAILHDIYVEREEWSTITYKDHPDLDYLESEQKQALMEHPKKAAELSHYFSNYSDVDFIIEEHHEQPDGNGFPRGLNAGKITQVSAIFIISSNFVIQLVMNGISQSSLRTIIRSFMSIYNVGNFKEPFSLLSKEIRRK